MAAARKTPEDSRRFASMVAQHQGWKLMGDPEFLNTLLAGLATNHNRYGYYLCPCRDSLGSRHADEDVICPCRYARPDIDEYGHCFCALYQSPAFHAGGAEPKAIPERSPRRE